MEEQKLKKFQPLNVSSKFAICGLPIRVDTYKNCSFGCSYCFANNRVIMEFDKHLQVGDINSVKRRLKKIFDDKKVDPTNFLDVLIFRGYTWHCGGMSDPFQPCEEKYNITRDLIKVSSEYGRSILFSTKSNTVYNCWDYLDPDLHTFQLSVTNVSDRKDLEPNVPSIESRVAFFDELKELVDKYNNIDDETITVIERIDNEIEDKYIKEYILKDSNKLDEIIAEYKNNLDIDKIIFFGWYNLNIEEISMDKISNYYNELISQKYTDNDSYLIYKNKNDLKEYTRNELDYMLSTNFHIDRLFDKESIIDFFLNNTTKEELIKEMMLDGDVEDILDLSPEYAFTLTDGSEYVFSFK